MPGDEPVWHIFAVRSPARDALAAHLTALGVETLIHYPVPVYRTPAFAAFGPGRRYRERRPSPRRS